MIPIRGSLRPALGWLACLLVAGPLGPADAAPPPADLLDQLLSESFPERVKASSALADWARKQAEGPEKVLVDLMESSADPELRKGVERALEGIVLMRLEKERPAYVGILMRPVRLGADPGGLGITVDRVNPGTPAERAGLKVGDLIVELDGEAWSLPGDPREDFGNAIAARKPGTQVRLTLRSPKGEEREVELTLAPRPWSLGEWGKPSPPPSGDLSSGEAEEQARQQVFRDWLQGRLESGRGR